MARARCRDPEQDDRNLASFQPQAWEVKQNVLLLNGE